MLDRILEYKDAMILYFGRHGINKNDALNEDDWILIEELCVVLRPLWLATKELSAEKFTTLSKVIPMVKLLVDQCTKDESNETDRAQEIRRLLSDGLKDKFNGIEANETYSISTILDPRFKNVLFSTKTAANQAVKFTKADALKIGHETRDVSDLDLESDNESEDTEDQADELWGNFDRKVANVNKKSNVKTVDHIKVGLDSEMSKYLS